MSRRKPSLWLCFFLWLQLSLLLLQTYGRPVSEPAPLARRGTPVNDFTIVDTFTGLNARGVDYCNVWDSFNSKWIRHLFWAVYHPTNDVSSPIYWETTAGSRTFTQHFTEDAARVENWICTFYQGEREVFRINEYNAATEGDAYNFRVGFMDFTPSSSITALAFPDGLSFVEEFSMTELGSGITTEYLTRAEYEDGSGTPFANNVRILNTDTGTNFPSIAADAVRHAPHFEFTNSIGLTEHCVLIGNTFDGSTYSRTSWLQCYDGTDYDTRVHSFATYGVRKFQVFVHSPTDIRIIVGNERSGTGSDYTPATEVYRFNGVTTASGTMTLEQSIPGGGVMDIAGYQVDGEECFFLCRGRDNSGTTVDSYEYCWHTGNAQYELSRTITTTACSGVAYVEPANGDLSKTLAIAQEGTDSLLVELEPAPPTTSQSQSSSPSQSQSQSPSKTNSDSSSQSASMTQSPPPTQSPERTASPTPTVLPSNSPARTASQPPTQSPTPSAPPTNSPKPSPSPPETASAPESPPPSQSPVPGNVGGQTPSPTPVGGPGGSSGGDNSVLIAGVVVSAVVTGTVGAAAYHQRGKGQEKTDKKFKETDDKLKKLDEKLREQQNLEQARSKVAMRKMERVEGGVTQLLELNKGSRGPDGSPPSDTSTTSTT